MFRSDRLLYSASRAAQLLLADTDDFDATIHKVLEIIGTATDTDRVYVWSIHESPHPHIDPGLHTSQLYEWSVKVEAMQDTDICINRPIEVIGPWINAFLEGKCVNNLVRRMSQVERDQLEPQGIISILTAPIMFHGELWGFIGFDNCHEEYIWSEAEENILRATGSLIGTAIHKRRINEALTQSQGRFQSVEQATGEIIWSVGENYILEYISDRVTAVLGFDSAECVGKPLFDFLLEDDGRHILAAPDQPILRGVELRARTKDGGFKWTRISCLYSFDAQGAMTQGFGAILDISEVREAQEKLYKAKEDLEKTNLQLAQAVETANKLADEAQKINKIKGEFLANMSHEIRTPINAIMGMTHILLGTSLQPRQREFLEKLDFASRTLLHVINDILDFSKVDAGKMNLEHAPFFVEDTIHGVGVIVAQCAEDKGLGLHVDIEPAVRGQYLGDALRLAQVLTNLVTNAIKFTPKGDISINVRLMHRLATEDELHFSVRDSGIGLTQKQMAHIFAPFRQADSSTTRRYGGTGLGLALCKKLVELMGGQIWCESQPNSGSTFHFTCAVTRQDSVGRPQRPPVSIGDLQVVVCERNTAACANVADICRTLGCRNVRQMPLSDKGEPGHDVAGLGLENGYDLLILCAEAFGTDSFKTLSRAHGFGDSRQGATIILFDAATEDTAAQIPAHRVSGPQTVLQRPLTAEALCDSLALLFGSTLDCAEQNDAPRVTQEFMREFGGRRILLVEDNEINCIVANEILTQAGLRVTLAGNGQVALDLLAHQTFDIVLMDIQMPVMDGITATRHIRQQVPHAALPIVAMTAHAMPEDVQKSLDAGMNAHITKPIDSTELFKTLAHWLRKSAKNEPLEHACPQEERT